MSTIATGQTRQRGEAIAAALEAHPPFADWKAEGRFRVIWNASRNLKMGLEDKLASLMGTKVAKNAGVLVTITPFEGSNTSQEGVKVSNETTFQVSVWERLTTRPDNSTLPDPLDLLDEMQRVLASIEFEYPAAGGQRPCGEKVRVLGWEEAPDPHYLLYQITIACRVLLGTKGA